MLFVVNWKLFTEDVSSQNSQVTKSANVPVNMDVTLNNT